MFIDTSIIIDIIVGNNRERAERIFDAIGASPIIISVVQIAEIADWCSSHGADTERRIAQLKDIANVLPLSDDICIDAARIKNEMRGKGLAKFSLTDGIILASAWSLDEKLLTLDPDFRKAADAVLIP